LSFLVVLTVEDFSEVPTFDDGHSLALPGLAEKVNAHALCSSSSFLCAPGFDSRPGFSGSVKADAVFKITQLMPAADDELQYRIRTASEPYERVAKESQLDRVTTGH
jgi:hypothetical protein